MRPVSTERLLVREFTLGDLDGLVALYGDPEVLWWEPEPYSPEKTREALEIILQRYADDGIAENALIERESGVLVGECGAAFREIDGERLPELGWCVRSDRWGRGYATEAAQAVIAYLGAHVTEPDISRVYSLITPGNAASRRVATKLAMTIERRVLWAGTPHDLSARDLPCYH